MADNVLQHEQPALLSNPSQLPGLFVYKFLTLSSGPTGTSTIDMDTVSNATPSVFEYTVPAGQSFNFARINLALVDASINPGDFGGIAGGLSNGCLFEIIDKDGFTQVLDFTDSASIKKNIDFVSLAGTDIPITALAGDDQLPVRFSIFKAGANMKLTAGQRVRWTNQDDLSALTFFRAMVQGLLKDG